MGPAAQYRHPVKKTLDKVYRQPDNLSRMPSIYRREDSMNERQTYLAIACACAVIALAILAAWVAP